MSDDGFLDDEIYALATGEDKSRKKKSSEGRSRKRPRADLGTSDMDDSDDGPAKELDNPYPLEGRYIDYADKERLEEMPEIQREEILAQRLEEIQKRTDKLNISKFLGQRDAMTAMGEDSVAQAAKRKRTLTASAKEKAHTRDALKASRKARDERRAHHVAGKRDTPSKSKRARRDSSDMDTSSDSNRSDGDDDDDDDGRNRGSRKNSEKNKPAKEEEKPLTVSDLGRIQLTRTQLAKECMKPWFENYIKGAWVRYLIGQRDGAPVYRICEIKGLCPQIVLPYAVENEMVNQQLQLAFGSSLRFFNMDKVSNGPFTEREFNRLVLTCQTERVILPTQGQINDKRDNIKECENRRLTEADVSAIISRRRTLNPNAPNFQKRIAEGSRIRQELQTAAARNDKAEVARLKEELDAYNLRWGDSTAGSDSDISSKPGLKREGSGISLNGDSMLEEISRRNRELNHENARKLQIQEAERRKKAHLERLKQEAAKANSLSEPQRLSDVTLTKEDALTKNPDLAGKDIGTQMAHSVELSLPDF